MKQKNKFSFSIQPTEDAGMLDFVLENFTSLPENKMKNTPPAPTTIAQSKNGAEELKKYKSNTIRILLLEDSEADADLLIRHLRKEKINFDYIRVLDKEAFLVQLLAFKPDLIIADYTLPQFNGIEAFRLMKEENLLLPFILVTGSISEKLIHQLIKEGIDDYLLKDNLLRLPNAIMNIVHKKQLETEKKITEELNKLLVLSNNKLEEVYRDIKSSIDYAKRIQEDMLPELHFLKRANIQHMLIYQPKDVLSGDFYWTEQKENKLFIAVADCTGHGVPGALLSMSGHNIINEIVNMDNISNPAEILNHLNERFRKMLKQDTTSTHDGMDIGFCVIDIQTKKVEYAGAKIPLYYINGDGLEKIIPDSVSIGGVENNKVQFHTCTIQLRKGDRLFMFSDGITDQFDFSNRAKITRKRFERILRTFYFSQITSVKQEILNFFNTWKGETEQTDDILILGMEIW
jgi:phosphoserine phosphatase RsbU/P